jgi:succinylarginine dihydrolase
MKLVEVQVDRIVGPTHHFGGLGVGNVASHQHHGSVSNPRAAALQGLDKMRLVAGLGVPQIVLPPQKRPHVEILQNLGFAGSIEEVLAKAAIEAPEILSAAMSSSAMWTANAATVTPSVDLTSESLSVTVANLGSSLHRAIEPLESLHDLQMVFGASADVLPPVDGGAAMRDEGAANHMRLGSDLERPGIHVFVYGDQDPLPGKFWPRQTLAACQAIARRHNLRSENTFFLKQHPKAIDAGAFHNDVVAASHHNLFLHHAAAYYDAEQTLADIERRYVEICGCDLRRIEVSEKELSTEEAIGTYLFNSQIVSTTDSPSPTLLCPTQVAENENASRIVRRWVDEGLFQRAEFLELRQSMSGGGGPACLRLRVPMNEAQLSSLKTNAFWSPSLDQKLRQVIQEDYPESLASSELSNAKLARESHAAIRRIKTILSATTG